MKVLLVEDDRTMRTILRTLLELERFEVISWNGSPDEEIIPLIRFNHPDVVLLDVHLRKISGIDILRQVRTDDELCSTSILMTSGMDVKDQCIEAGADGFLMKPYMPDDLIQLIRTQEPR